MRHFILSMITSMITIGAAQAADYQFTCTMQGDRRIRAAQVLVEYTNKTPTGIYDAHYKRRDPHHEKNVITYLEVEIAFSNGRKHKATFNQIYAPLLMTSQGNKLGRLSVDREWYNSSLPTFNLQQQINGQNVDSSLSLRIPVTFENYPDTMFEMSSIKCVDLGLRTVPESLKKAWASTSNGQHPSAGSGIDVGPF